MEYEKNTNPLDYSLLRPATIEYVKAGGEVCWSDGDKDVECFVTNDDRIILYTSYNRSAESRVKEYLEAYIRQVPLYWIEGKPVYKGDVLYTPRGEEFLVGDITDFNIVIETDKSVDCKCATIDALSWTKPVTKKKYWVNLYDDESGGLYWAKHLTKDAADKGATDARGDVSPFRIACVEIELEE